jgi:hypothetical protein
MIIKAIGRRQQANKMTGRRGEEVNKTTESLY